MKDKKLYIHKKIQIVLYILFLFLWFISSKITILRMISIILFAIFSVIQVADIVKRRKISTSKIIYLYILFTIWAFLSTLWAENASLTIDRAIDLTCNSIFLIISYDFFANINIGKKEFISIFIIIGILFSIYIFGYYGITKYASMLLAGKRIGTQIINVNFIGVLSTITFLLIIYAIVNGIYKRKALIIISILPLITALGSGSRKSVIGLIVGLIIIFLLYFRGKITAKKIITLVVSALVLLAFTTFMRMHPYFDTVFERMDSMISTLSDDTSTIEGSTYTRKLYIEEGLKTFSRHPLTGIGLNNSGLITQEVTGKETYLHCNYVELLACLGLFGFALYYAIYVRIMAKSIKKMAKDSDMALPLMLILVMFVVEIGCVTYYEIKTGMLMTLMLIIIEKQWNIREKRTKKRIK